jgi:hypothetical protein
MEKIIITKALVMPRSIPLKKREIVINGGRPAEALIFMVSP